ncbi:hypothetical protein GGF41_007856, partial [Coemansia sp. RSA 2531]
MTDITNCPVKRILRNVVTYDKNNNYNASGQSYKDLYGKLLVKHADYALGSSLHIVCEDRHWNGSPNGITDPSIMDKPAVFVFVNDIFFKARVADYPNPADLFTYFNTMTNGQY